MAKRECAVLPPDNSSAAKPEEATAKATSPRLRTSANSNSYRKVLPVPPGPSTKKSLACIIIRCLPCAW